jgi:hypothetical protein
MGISNEGQESPMGVLIEECNEVGDCSHHPKEINTLNGGVVWPPPCMHKHASKGLFIYSGLQYIEEKGGSSRPKAQWSREETTQCPEEGVWSYA